MASPLKRTLEFLGFRRSEMLPGVTPPPRSAHDEHVTANRAMTLSTVYRSVSIHATAACQLSIDVERGGAVITAPSLISRPSLSMSRSAFLEYVVTSLYLGGDSFWRLTRADVTSSRPGEVVDMEPLNPDEVGVHVDRTTKAVTYSYRGETLYPRDIKHLQLLRVPGRVRGLGPVQAAQVELAGALDARDYGSKWMSESDQPDGVLTTDQELKPGDTDVYKNIWYGRNADGSEKETAKQKNYRERLRVLGKGLHYSPLMLKPADLQFLETQQFTALQIVRLFGAPASQMLVSTDGDSQSYQNVEQDWIGYVRFGLMLALREIEEAFTDLLPHGQKARFNLEALLRSDTKTRYEGYKIALDPKTGWLTDDEVRAFEGLAPLTTAQRALRAAALPIKTTTPAKEPTNA